MIDFYDILIFSVVIGFIIAIFICGKISDNILDYYHWEYGIYKHGKNGLTKFKHFIIHNLGWLMILTWLIMAYVTYIITKDIIVFFATKSI